MSLMIKFFCCIIVIGLGGLFILKKPDGTPWLSASDFIPDTDSLTSSVKNAIPDQVMGGSGDNVSVYKWKDEQGNLQFSDTPPENSQAQQILVDTNLNKDIAPLKPKVIAKTKTSQTSGKARLIKDSSLGVTTLSPSKVTTLIKDANNVQNLVDDRQRQLEAAMPK